MDLIDSAEEINIPGMIFSIDFQKAFDTISWDYLNTCLEYFGFGCPFIKWINAIHNNSSSCIINNGWTSELFNLERGARQGCPLSAYIFLICVEILGISVRQNRDIKGMKLYGEEFKLSQFADDTQLLLDGSKQSLASTINLLEEYEMMSGLKVNFDKSEIASIGSSKGIKYNIEKDIKWQSEQLKVLGVTIPIDGKLNKIINLNYTTCRK